MKTTAADFGRALDRALASRGLRQTHLAELVGVKQNTVSRWVSGEAVPDPWTVFDVERALKLEGGTLSKHLGYVPVGAVPRCTVPEAIDAAPELSEYQRDALISVYRVLTAPEPAT